MSGLATGGVTEGGRSLISQGRGQEQKSKTILEVVAERASWTRHYEPNQPSFRKIDYNHQEGVVSKDRGRAVISNFYMTTDHDQFFMDP